MTIRIQEKFGGGDWRAFLTFNDTEEKAVYQLRGYGTTPGEAADDAWKEFKEGMEDDFAYSLGVEGPYPYDESSAFSP